MGWLMTGRGDEAEGIMWKNSHQQEQSLVFLQHMLWVVTPQLNIEYAVGTWIPARYRKRDKYRKGDKYLNKVYNWIHVGTLTQIHIVHVGAVFHDDVILFTRTVPLKNQLLMHAYL